VVDDVMMVVIIAEEREILVTGRRHEMEGTLQSGLRERRR
jgi:hypothetical protein